MSEHGTLPLSAKLRAELDAAEIAALREALHKAEHECACADHHIDALRARAERAEALLWKLQPAVDLDRLESENPEAACEYEYFVQDRAALTPKEKAEGR